ncbi:hypothetical protein ABB27_02410 [Stenotrophomonas terrae]|uniref:Uncharacterized protein n=1 Tax=Stenotrophomonas terrae TaxID=405446 RepID=A0A0R0D2E0_9GAMM|nr:hypothetical protein [Stenotrophomonas terrae]KRG71763.1 hypothetical protein ABB27_02410 [Stenotrophomonas terrae]
MSYEDVKTDLDDLAIEMATSNHAWTKSRRLEKLRALAILTRRALKEATGTSNEQERRNSIEAVLDRIKSMLAATEQLEALQESYRN